MTTDGYKEIYQAMVDEGVDPFDALDAAHDELAGDE